MCVTDIEKYAQIINNFWNWLNREIYSTVESNYSLIVHNLFHFVQLLFGFCFVVVITLCWVLAIRYSHSRRGQFLPSLRFCVHFKRPLIILSSIYAKYMLTYAQNSFVLLIRSTCQVDSIELRWFKWFGRPLILVLSSSSFISTFNNG